MKTPVRLLLILAVVLSASALRSQTLDDAFWALNNEEPARAKSILLAIVKANPGNAEAAYKLGNYYYLTGNKDSARICYERGILPDDKVNYNFAGLGKLMLDQKDETRALEYFNKLTATGRSKDSKAYAFVGEAYYSSSSQNLEKAAKALEKAVELNSKNAEAYLLLGDVYLQMNNAGKAITSYEYSIEANPKMALAYLKIGQVFMKSGTYDEALENFRKAYEVDSNFAPAYRELGEFNYRAKNYSDASRLYKKYIDVTGEDIPKLSRYASFQFLNKDYPSAIAIIEKIMTQDSSNFILSRLIGYSYYEQAKYMDGLNYMRKFFEKADSTKFIASDFEYYGRLLSKTKNDSLATIYLSKAIALDPSHHELIGELSTAYYSQKKFTEAAIEMEKMLKVHRGTSTDYFQLGKSYYYINDYIHADSAFMRVCELQPTLALGFLWRARSVSLLDPESVQGLAVPHYQKFTELATDENKFKKELIEAYSYLGYFHYLKNDLATSEQAWTKVKALDPGNAQAEEFFKSQN